MMVTGLYTAILGMMFFYLSLKVVKGRVACNTAIGDGGNAMLQQRIRAQANFAEYTPLFLILMAMLEVEGVAKSILYALGFFFVLGRVCHAYAFLKDEKIENGDIKKVSKYRMRGMSLTFMCYVAASTFLFIEFVFRQFGF